MIILDDYNRMFTRVPVEISFENLYERYRSFDVRENSKLCAQFTHALQPLGDYETIAYSTGSDAIRHSVQWLLAFRIVQEISYFKGIYHSEYFLACEQSYASKSEKLSIMDWDPHDPHSILKAVSSRANSAIILELTFSDYLLDITPEFFHDLKKLCAERNSILLIDEIRTGLFRTGTFSYSQQLGIKPDLICFAKGLGLGVPAAVACWSKELYEKIDKSLVKNARTSQVTNTFSLHLASTLLDMFTEKQFLEKMEATAKFIQQLCAEYLGDQLLQTFGFLVKLKLRLTISKIMRLFKELIDEQIFVRFPANGVLILVFPFDMELSVLTSLFAKLRILLVKYEN